MTLHNFKENRLKLNSERKRQDTEKRFTARFMIKKQYDVLSGVLEDGGQAALNRGCLKKGVFRKGLLFRGRATEKPHFRKEGKLKKGGFDMQYFVFGGRNTSFPWGPPSVTSF